MVILSIVVVIGSRFMVMSAAAYNRAEQRARLIDTSRQALERISRQLRGALPNSLRLTNGGDCLMFLPIVSGGNYLNPLPDTQNGAAAVATIATTPHSVSKGAANFVVVGAVRAVELFGADPVSLAGLSARTDNALTLTTAKIWQRNSIKRRFFLVDNPQAFCVTAGELRFYDDQDITGAGVNFRGNFQLLANNALTGAGPFTISPGTEDRNAKVSITIGFGGNGERIDFTQEVGLRNVP